jgi:hypothetical protein
VSKKIFKRDLGMEDLQSLEGKAVELIEKFESIAEIYGAVDLGLNAVRIIGVQTG